MTTDQNLNPPTMSQVWDRLPDESQDAFAAFTAYLQLGSDATLLDVAAKTAKSHGAIRNLSSRHNWSERAAAWRQHVAGAALAAVKSDTIENERLWNLRLQVARERRWERLQKAELLADQLLNKYINDPDAEMPAYVLPQLLRAVTDTADKAIAHVVKPDQSAQSGASAAALRDYHEQMAKALATFPKASIPEPPAPQQPPVS